MGLSVLKLTFKIPEEEKKFHMEISTMFIKFILKN